MPEKDVPTYPWLIERRYLPLMIVLIFVVLSAITFIICYRHHAINTEQTLKDDRSTANLVSLVLDEHLKKIVSIMESYSNRPLLLQAVRDKNAEKARVHLINLKKSNPDIDILVITDRQGTLWAAYPERPELLGKNLAWRDWYKGVSKEWKSNITDVILRIVREKDLAVTISVPFVDEKGEVIGILVNTQRTVGLSYLFKQAPLDPGADITVTDRQGQIVYSSRHDVEKEIRLYSFYPGMKKAMAAKNKTFAMDDPDLGGRTRYLSFAPIVNIGWTVFVGRDKHSIILSESAYYIQVMAVAFFLFLSIILFIFYSRKQVMAQQILEQLQAEKKIRAGDEKLRALSARQEGILAAVPEIIIEVDNNKIYTWANSGGIEFFGEDVIGKEAAFYFEGEQDTYDTVRPLFNGAEDIIYVESWQRRRDGEKRLLAWWCRVLKDEDGNVTGALSSARDITEHKRAEEEIQANRVQLSNALEMAHLGHWEYDVANDLFTFNDHFYKLFRTTVEQVGGYTMHSAEYAHRFVHPDDMDVVGEETRKAIDTTDPHFNRQIEHQILYADGKVGYISIRFFIVKDSHGRTVKTYGVNQDITERKQAEDEIKKLNAELEQRVIARTAQLEAANKELESFSYSVSHDLRAPLRSIDGFSQALLEEYKDKLDDAGKNYLERVRKASQRMGRLIDDLLNLSRVTRSEFQYESIYLSGMVRAIAETIQKNNPERTVGVIVREGINVKGDPYLMRIAMDNLLDNAWKFTGKMEHPRIEFGAVIKDGETIYFIKDNGVGFDMAYAGKLFGAVQRLHSTAEFPGTGIGLATVRRIIHRHGGHIWAEGEVGKGATFYFTIA